MLFYVVFVLMFTTIPHRHFIESLGKYFLKIFYEEHKKDPFLSQEKVYIDL